MTFVARSQYRRYQAFRLSQRRFEGGVQYRARRNGHVLITGVVQTWVTVWSCSRKLAEFVHIPKVVTENLIGTVFALINKPTVFFCKFFAVS